MKKMRMCFSSFHCVKASPYTGEVPRRGGGVVNPSVFFFAYAKKNPAPFTQGSLSLPSGIGFKVLFQKKQADSNIIFSIVRHGRTSFAVFS